MTKTKTNDVVLVVPEHNMTQVFGVDHAERLLRMPNNGGWQLPEDSEFEFDMSDGIKRKQHKGTAESAKK